MINEGVGCFFSLFSVFVFFSLPLCIYFLKKDRELDMLLIPVMGLLNLLFILFLYANISFFINVRGWDIVLFLVTFWLLEMFLVIFRIKSDGLPFKLVNLWHCLLILTVSLVIFIFLSKAYFDQVEGKYYHPGYGINHDSIKILSSIKVFSKNIGMLDNSMARSANDLYTSTGYPLGGTFINVFFSRLFKLDPYLIYQKLLLFIFLLNLFVINFFSVKVFKKVDFLLRTALIFISPFCVFNYLSLNIVNSSSLGSTIVTPLLFLVILLFLLRVYKRVTRRLFLLLFVLSVVGAVFVYSYITVVYCVLFIILALLIFGKVIIKRCLFVYVLIALVLVFLLPINFSATKILITNQFGSTNSEVNLFKGMTGNTIGFINPMTAFSLWFDNVDYRFSTVTIGNIWLFFTLMFPLFFLSLYRDRKNARGNDWKTIFVLTVPFVFFVAVSFWIVKSPYQNVKSMFYISVLWPLVLFLIVSRQLSARKIWIRVVTVFYLLTLLLFFHKSSLLAVSYIGKPIVKSNYELMKIESDFCGDRSSKLFIGRDELSVYFLLSCDNVRFYYDRFENNVAFWEIIKINNMASLDQKCESGSLKLTTIDFLPYKEVLIDKCFVFENKSYRLRKEYDVYRWYERID